MRDGEKGLEMAADVLKQLVTLCTAIVAATLALFLANKDNDVCHWWPFSSAIAGGLCILASLLFLTDISARSLGSRGHKRSFRLCLFVVTWVLFFLCAAIAAGYVLKLSGVV